MTEPIVEQVQTIIRHKPDNRISATNRADAASVLRAVVYARVSTQEQAQNKASIPDQLEVCRKTIQDKGWRFINEYKDEGISGHLTEERHLSLIHI